MSKAFSEWLSSESGLFTLLCGESFTHRDVAIGCLCVVVLLLCISVAGTID